MVYRHRESFAGCGVGASDAGSVHVVRADPARFRLTLLAASAQPGGRALPVTRWAAEHDLVVATNAGMYHPDFERHVGLMVDRGHENNPVAVSDYKSVLAKGANVLAIFNDEVVIPALSSQRRVSCRSVSNKVLVQAA